MFLVLRTCDLIVLNPTRPLQASVEQEIKLFVTRIQPVLKSLVAGNHGLQLHAVCAVQVLHEELGHPRGMDRLKCVIL